MAGLEALAVRAALDHLVVAARDLEEGRAWLERQLGVSLAPGGVHERFSTHNRLLALGAGAYLELIAVNPAAPAPGRARWFGLDRPELQDRLAERPRLIHWVAQVSDLPAAKAASPEDHGEPLELSRGDLRWSLTVPPDGQLPLGGVLPSLIAWGETAHPTTRLPASGVRLESLDLLTPEPARLSVALDALGLVGIARVQAAPQPGLRATLLTPGGTVTLD